MKIGPIEDDIPIPPKGGGGNRLGTSPLDNIAVGQSVFYAGRSQKIVSSVFYGVAKRTGHKFTTRKVTENGVAGVRVWRIE